MGKFDKDYIKKKKFRILLKKIYNKIPILIK